ncbi:hypothetical protein RFI_39256 [Reticulomyxa filosa]|uniref:CAP-Gly domain-containing protein n=1 Tax=Reticulomyxa filosa TaxID=46433 RepID=X6LBY9_RETFI|nr:hypothetical protein RFI_39256 [Reticulomyxa filosa]|eukprot:ETN98254.1 hypothetical protein RFI_39256 [Reticulomyxa filosa]
MAKYFWTISKKQVKIKSKKAELNDEDEDNKAEHGCANSTVVNLVDVAIGDRYRFRVLENKTGVVHYLGDMELSNEKLIEIELDSWHPNTIDGIVRGKIYFKVSFNLFVYLFLFCFNFILLYSTSLWRIYDLFICLRKK